MEVREQELLTYAYEKFQEGCYDEALEVFVLLYNRGYERKWILDNVYSCYVDCNYSTFYKTYKRYKANELMTYESCVLDFIPYKEGEYFIYDKREETFSGIFSIPELDHTEMALILKKNEFSPVTIEFDGRWENVFEILSEAKDRKIYAICSDLEVVMSYFKIPELEQYLCNVRVFDDSKRYQEYLHRYTDQYLPRLVVADTDRIQVFQHILENEHEYRMSSLGRNKRNIILTIGIPTHNRGNLLLERIEKLRKMPYDAEIEIVVSKNGALLYQEEYNKASQIQDARLLYYGVDKELSPQVNWHNVVEHAHGKFVLFVSDEDDVILDAMEHYLKLLSTAANISLVRAEATIQNSKKGRLYGYKGLDAFSKEFLAQYYLSGMIVNRQYFLDADMLKYELYQDNIFYQSYPHEWWCANLTQYGDYIMDPVILIEEKDASMKAETLEYEKRGIYKEGEIMDQKTGLPKYSTYESRFQQFDGQIQFLKIFTANDREWIKTGLGIAISKLVFVLDLARKCGYKKEKYLDVLDQFVMKSINAIDEFELDGEQKVELLKRIRGYYKIAFDNHMRYA